MQAQASEKGRPSFSSLATVRQPEREPEKFTFRAKKAWLWWTPLRDFLESGHRCKTVSQKIKQERRVKYYISVFRDQISHCCQIDSTTDHKAMENGVCDRLVWAIPRISGKDSLIIRRKSAAHFQADRRLSWAMVEAAQGWSGHSRLTLQAISWSTSINITPYNNILEAWLVLEEKASDASHAGILATIYSFSRKEYLAHLIVV